MKPPRVSAKVAVDPAWGKPCTCVEGVKWRAHNRAFPDYPQRKCPSCGGDLIKPAEGA